MCRLLPALLLLATLVPGGEAKRGRLFRTKLAVGDRYTGLNVISVDLTTTVRQGDRETVSKESMQRTSKFLDEVARAGENGVLEIRRTYNMLYTKVTESGDERPVVHNSPLKGRTVIVTEKQRRRDVHAEDGSAVDPDLRRIVGFELDWRDVFPDEPVQPGDAWEGDAKALSRRLATFFDSGNRSRMRVRYEEDEDRGGRRVAKLYVDWSIQGMRDRHLFTKVDLAGDVYFDIEMRRVTEVDLVGRMVVRGAIVDEGPPRIVKGEGAVVLKSQIRPAPVEAAAGADE